MVLCQNKRWKILQVIPAQAGWKAVHCQEADNSQVKISNRSVICWALVKIEEDGAARTEVRGVEQKSTQLVIVGDLIQTDKTAERGVNRNEYFLGYDDPESHKESDYWIEQASVRLKRKE